MAETGTRTQLINLEGLSTFLDESKKIFEPTLPAGTDGQVLKLSSGKPTWGTDNTPTAFKWTGGTTAGPTGSLSGNGMSAVSFAAIPSAGASASGIVTTGAQTFEGVKTFNKTIKGNISGNAGGNAATATKLTTSAGGTTEPIYFSDGKPAKTGYTFASSISSDAADNNVKLPTSSAVISYVDSKIRAADAMIYKGTIGTGGTVTALPSSTALTGWTYKVVTAGTYAGVSCEIGDMIICLTDGSSSKSATWTVVQTNIDGAVTSSATSVTDSHIPLFSGTTGKVIKSSSRGIVTSVKNSDNIPTDKAVKTYVDNLINGINNTIGNVETLLANI